MDAMSSGIRINTDIVINTSVIITPLVQCEQTCDNSEEEIASNC